jgi:hypothetical protein
MFGQEAGSATVGGHGGAVVSGKGIDGTGETHEHHEASGNEKFVHWILSLFMSPEREAPLKITLF